MDEAIQVIKDILQMAIYANDGSGKDTLEECYKEIEEFSKQENKTVEELEIVTAKIVENITKVNAGI